MSQPEPFGDDWTLEVAAAVLSGTMPKETVQLDELVYRLGVLRQRLAPRTPEPEEGETARCTCEWLHPVDGSVDPTWPAVMDPRCHVHAGHDYNGLATPRARSSHPKTRDGERIEGWQPIETAPRDGTAILVHSRAGWIGSVSWWSDEDRDEEFDDSCFQDEHGEPVEPADLTHWMPLPPAPPATSESGQGGTTT